MSLLGGHRILAELLFRLFGSSERGGFGGGGGESGWQIDWGAKIGVCDLCRPLSLPRKKSFLRTPAGPLPKIGGHLTQKQRVCLPAH